MDFLIIAVIVTIAFIGIGYITSPKRKSKILIKKIQEQYWDLNEIVLPLYYWKDCPKCGENVMNIRRLLPNGKSIEYSCDFCNKVITSKLIEGKNPRTALGIIEDIKSNMEALTDFIGDGIFKRDIDISFVIDSTNGIDEESPKRQPIPESVRHEVWRRDQGKCVKCESKIHLEFDHIVPVSKGGSNTARNIQLLCELCNRNKSDRI